MTIEKKENIIAVAVFIGALLLAAVAGWVDDPMVQIAIAEEGK